MIARFFVPLAGSFFHQFALTPYKKRFLGHSSWLSTIVANRSLELLALHPHHINKETERGSRLQTNDKRDVYKLTWAKHCISKTAGLWNG